MMCILKPDLETEAAEAVYERLTSAIQAGDGAVDDINKWGRRRLAYEVDECKDGIYVVLNFKSNAEVAKELARMLKFTDEVLRFMIVRTDG